MAYWAPCQKEEDKQIMIEWQSILSNHQVLLLTKKNGLQEYVCEYSVNK